MMQYEYKYLECPGTELEATLNELGRDGWRLHTCEPYFFQDLNGDVSPRFNVVMDRAFQLPPPNDPGSSVIERPEAIACKS